MATLNPFDLLDGDAEDPSLFIAVKQIKQIPPVASVNKKVREARNDGQRGGGRGGPRGGLRGRGRGFNQEFVDGENTFGSTNGFSGGYRASEDGESGKPSERRAGVSLNVSSVYVLIVLLYRYEFKREGAGRGNWGAPTDELAPENKPVNIEEKIVDAEKQDGQADDADANKDSPMVEPQEKEPEEKEMTLEEYEKVMEEKRKALLALKPEERKVNLDKEFASMQLLSNKKNDDEVFIKLGAEKDKHKEAVEKAKKTKSINEFLKPADGESYYRSGGRGRGVRGRGRGGNGGNNGFEAPFVKAPSIEDVGQFPSLGAAK
ncbi:hypothetical protein T459_16964 [Capsicum annuum]|uniref:Hyaluronan/mRNA-binding protein domain-containing protein n=1 Tax=Capsicum annuum TaxID=4072 RepID=A0A2G2ZA80_CAPAN|nr:hypothetical protein T459_16964 [Capsicum annuum]